MATQWHITVEFDAEIEIDEDEESERIEFGDKLGRRIGDWVQSLGYDMELNMTSYGALWYHH